MKLNKFSAVAGLGFLLASGAAFADDQGHGTITFNGSIIDAPCSITPETANQTVDMGQISNKVLEKEGKSTPRPFYIKLENCDVSSLANKAVTTTFSGTASKAQPKKLALVGQASGAAIAIINGDGTSIDLGSPSQPTSVQAGRNTLSFAAYLQADPAVSGGKTTVVPGEFSSVANFTLAYQ